MIQSLKQHLVSVGASFPEAVGTEYDKLLVELERSHGIQLPNEYRKFLSEIGAVEFESEVVYRPAVQSPWTMKDGTAEVISFYGLGPIGHRIDEVMLECQELLGAGYVPIAEANGGNRVCLELASGKIYFWDHEGEVENVASNMYLVANCLREFILDISACDEPKEVPEPTSFSFSPGLLKEIEKTKRENQK